MHTEAAIQECPENNCFENLRATMKGFLKSKIIKIIKIIGKYQWTSSFLSILLPCNLRPN